MMKNLPNSNPEKHIGFLVDCPKQGDMMMFPDWVENISLDQYEEVTDIITLTMKMRKSLVGTKYKIFKTK